jgi:hypothetical protein
MSSSEITGKHRKRAIAQSHTWHPKALPLAAAMDEIWQHLRPPL